MILEYSLLHVRSTGSLHLENHVEAIVIGPGPTDIPLVERLVARGDVLLTAVISPGEGDAADWFRERDIEVFDSLEDVPRLLPGCLVLVLSGDPGSIGALEDLEAGTLSVVGREVAELLAGLPAEAGEDGGKAMAAFNRYRRLLEDYSPTSRNSSTSVKLAACLTEATTIWSATGGAILTGVPGGGTLAIAAQRGADLPRDLKVPVSGSGPVERCYSLEKHLVADLPEDGAELLPGVDAASAACVSMKASSSTQGLLVLWFSEPGHFEQSDLNILSLFGYYAGILLEVDLLGERLEENLIIDPLTGLSNRRQFDHRLGLEVKRAERYTLNVSLVVMKVDNLDEYNDACGHMLGNLALSDIALIIDKGTREVDTIARIDEDEFALVLPETNRLGALKLADRLREEVSAYPFPVPKEGDTASLTMSAGIATYPGSAKDARELVAQAHRALENARERGPNLAQIWEND